MLFSTNPSDVHVKTSLLGGLWSSAKEKLSNAKDKIVSIMSSEDSDEKTLSGAGYTEDVKAFLDSPDAEQYKELISA